MSCSASNKSEQAHDCLAPLSCGAEAKVIGKQAYGWYKKHRENTQGLPEVPSWFDDTLEFTSSAVYHAPRPRLNALYKAMAAERCNRLVSSMVAQACVSPAAKHQWLLACIGHLHALNAVPHSLSGQFSTCHAAEA
jgi:hypothetical protein